ncbi:MAG: NUDIX hydrolase [Verrucomicrobia bacterium]|nr:NUDIX hydrolase [Verrucomicrobiota bacterium]
MASFKWKTEPIAKDWKITQVYGFCFDEKGRVLVLQDERGKFTLPGGHPEPTDSNLGATLARECHEEASIIINTPIYLGVQEVTEDDGSFHAQVRMIATINSWEARKQDPATGHFYRRLLTPLNKVPSLLNWGIDALLQAASAANLAEAHSITIRISRQDEYRD